jgi:hypothetical protein
MSSFSVSPEEAFLIIALRPPSAMATINPQPSSRLNKSSSQSCSRLRLQRQVLQRRSGLYWICCHGTISHPFRPRSQGGLSFQPQAHHVRLSWTLKVMNFRHLKPLSRQIFRSFKMKRINSSSSKTILPAFNSLPPPRTLQAPSPHISF